MPDRRISGQPRGNLHRIEPGWRRNLLAWLGALLIGGCATSTVPPETALPAGSVVEKSGEVEAAAGQTSSTAASSPEPASRTAAKKTTRKKQRRWLKTLDEFAGQQQLQLNAKKFPQIAWLSARWCLQGDNSGIPALFYKVGQTPTGFLDLSYADPDGSDKHYQHVFVTGSYYDLWDGFGFGEYLKDQGGRRLEKISEHKFALVYIFDEKPQRDRYDQQVLIDYASHRASEIGAADHIGQPKIYSRCD